MANWQYYLPQFAGGRHEFKGGFDNGYTPEDVDTTRVDDVNLTFRSQPTPVANTVTIFNSPLHQERAVMSTAFYGQDSYTDRAAQRHRRHPVGADRGVPAGTEHAGQPLLPRRSPLPGRDDQRRGAELHRAQVVRRGRHDPLWHDWAPRAAATYDLFGNGKTALKVSWGMYLDQINTGTPPNPNANINQQYVWNDLNGDLIFQPGTHVGRPEVRRRRVRYAEQHQQPRRRDVRSIAAAGPTATRPRSASTTSSSRYTSISIVTCTPIEKNAQGRVDQSMDQWNFALHADRPSSDIGRDGWP
jgi:hypothetical protein